MDYTVKNLEKTFNIEGEAIVNKIHNMQWLKNTSHSSNEKMKAISYKQIQDQDENNKEDKVLLKENVNACLVDEPEYHSIDTCRKYLSNDTMPIINENICNKDINIDISSFSNANKCPVSLNSKQEDISIIVENCVTAKLQTLCIDKEQSDQPNTLPFKNNTEDIQDAICSNLSKSQVTNQDTKELNLIKHCDDNNNDSKFTTQCLSKINNRYKEKTIDKITDAKNNNVSVEVKDRDVHIKKTINVPKTHIKNRNDTTLIKYNEKVSHSNDSKKSILNSSKSLSDVDKNGKLNRFNNRNTITKNIDCTRTQEFVKHNISKNEIEKETKNFNVKSSLVKTNFGTQSNKTINTACHNKNISKDKVLQKPQQIVSKQFVSKLKRQEYFKKSTSMLNRTVDKNKTFKKIEKTHVSKNLELSLSESEKKSEKTVNDKIFQSDQKKDRNINLKKNTTFVARYKNSTFSKSINFPKNTEYERNSLYTYNDPRFDREHTDNAEHAVIKREYTNEFSKSNIKSKELYVNNLEYRAKSQNEINHVQLPNVDKIDTLAINDKRNIDSIKTDTHTYFVGNKASSNFNIHTKQESIMSEQCHEKTEMINESKIDINQQNIDIKNEVDNEINPSKQSSNLSSNKCIVESLTNVIHKHVLKLENTQHTDVNQLGNNYTTSNDTSLGNVVQKNVTIVNSQESAPNMHFNTQQIITGAGNQMKKMSWGTNRNKFYDQYFSVSDVIPLSQIPNTFNVAPYECNMQTLSNSNVPAISALEMNSHKKNWNLLNKYIPNTQQSVMALSDFSNHFITSNQTNRWNTTIQDSFHVEHPYNAMKSTVMHVDSGISDSNDCNNAHVTNSLPHPVYSASPYMQQTWNPHLQYPISVVYNSPCVNYTMIPNTTNQSNNFNDGSIWGSYMQMNDYVKDTYRDLNNCAVQARSTADNIPIRSTTAQYINPVSYPNSQQGMNFTPATSINQSNACYLPNQRHHQKAMNYSTQMSRNSNGQTQDLICNDNSNDSEDTPPIISPKEFITDKTSLNKSDKFATYILKPEFKMRPNMGYCPSSRYNRDFHRNTTFKDFPQKYTSSISISREIHKRKV